MTWRTSMGTVLVATVVSAGLMLTPSPAGATEVEVSPGHSIQAAIDTAHPGQTIRVAPGVYHEDVWVHTNGIHLVGAGAGRTVLEPPVQPPFFCDNDASTVNGVCVANLPDANGNPGKIVGGFQISGFSIDGFPGFGVVLFGAEGAKVEHIEVASQGASGGIASFVSTGTRILDNTTTGSNQSVGNGPDEAGIIVADSPDAHATIEGNHSYGNHYGITVRDASGGRVSGNLLEGNCAGILVFASPYFGSGIAANWKVTDNRAHHNNAACLSDGGLQPVSGTGIALVGATRTIVVGNNVAGNRRSGDWAWPGGIVVTASTVSLPADDLLVQNTSLGNRQDLFWDRSGTRIRFVNNDCRTSRPAGLCGGD
jgi:parallel beta-helix repeat protein